MFLAVRKQISSPLEINFPVIKVIDSTNRQDLIYSEISEELSDFKNEKVQRTVQQISESDSVREAKSKRPDRREKEHTGNGRVHKKQRLPSR